MSKLPLPLPDNQPVAVNALRNKRAEIAGMIAMYEREVDRLRAELVHVDATLRLFDPGTDPADIAALRRFPRRTEYFARGEVTKRVYDALRAAPEIRAQDIADQAMRDKGMPETDRAQRREFVNRFLNVMGDMKRRGKLVKIGRAPKVRFKIAPREADLGV
jgi:hypothetical protein